LYSRTSGYLIITTIALKLLVSEGTINIYLLLLVAISYTCDFPNKFLAPLPGTSFVLFL